MALQMNYNHARQGRRGLMLTRIDRSMGPQVTTPDRAGPRRDRGHRRPRPGRAGARTVGGGRRRRLPDLRRGVLLRGGARRADGRAGRPVRRGRVRVRPGHRLPRAAVPGGAAALRAGRRGRAGSRSRCCAGAGGRGSSTPASSTARWPGRASRSSSATPPPTARGALPGAVPPPPPRRRPRPARLTAPPVPRSRGLRRRCGHRSASTSVPPWPVSYSPSPRRRDPTTATGSCGPGWTVTSGRRATPPPRAA